jgi:salicylate hydroxylase
VFQVIVPRSFMERSVATKELYDLQVFMSPGRSIVASTTPKRELYDVQLIDHEYGFELDHRPEIWNERVHDMTWLRNRFGDFDPAVRAILAEAQSYWKWRITDVTASALPSWTSKNGKVVLVGDSAHAMVGGCH